MMVIVFYQKYEFYSSAGRKFKFNLNVEKARTQHSKAIYREVRSGRNFSRGLDRKFWLTFKTILIDNHYKIVYEPVKTECSSCRALTYPA